ncbi:MAG: hypothetical protein ACTHQQ_01885 [Solirubrobacteraceae bacterium]
MHTATELASSDFAIEIAGRPGRLQDLFGGFTDRDRLGVIVRQPCGATGASALILAAVTAFYDIQRERHGSDGFFIYPDYFLFHVGERWGDHGMLDIWPSHKEVVVDKENAEELLRAVNDRAVTRLLVEDRPRREPVFERESLASAGDRIVSALAYSADGRLAEPDVTVTGNRVTESYVDAVFDDSDGGRDDIRAARRRLRDDGIPTESYRRLSLDEALARL